jgi:L-malate glycosyltransferase
MNCTCEPIVQGSESECMPARRRQTGKGSAKPSPKVLMFCPQFRPIVGGAERQAEKLARALVAAGCRVRILTPRREPCSPDFEEVDGVLIERFNLLDISRRYPVRGIALPNIPYILWQTVQALRPRLRSADVLHCHIASVETLGAVIAGRLAGVPALCKAAVADQFSDLGELRRTGPSGRIVARLVRAQVWTWVATTSAVRDALIRAGVDPARIRQIANGVELPPAPRARLPARPVQRFLYLGRLSRNTQRDVPTLITAFNCLAVDRPSVELALVGGGDLYEETQRLCACSPARDRIHLPGLDAPQRWLDWADCFVLPSRREGLSNALLEAMATGLPCIANDIPPNREVFDDGRAGVLVPVGDCQALETAMREMATRTEMAQHFALQSRQRAARHYAIEAVAQRYLALYAELASRRTG